MIPLDFVAGTHGHFIEYVLNRSIGFTNVSFDPFTSLGTSHQKPKEYLNNRTIICNHWFENDPSAITKSSKIIRIVFDQDDILLVSSVSLLRAADLSIDNNFLHIDTAKKLNNRYYADTLEKIYQSYDFLNRTQDHIPRNVLREYFKFGFADPTVNGYWKKLQQMCNLPANDVFEITLKQIYDIDCLQDVLQKISAWLDQPMDTGQWLSELHQKFLDMLPFRNHQNQCDTIIQAVINRLDLAIPALSLLQESYINGKLERHFNKEMPFHQIDYFPNTKDVLQYIESQAPKL